MNFSLVFNTQSGIGEYRPPEGLPNSDGDLMSFFGSATDSFLLVAGAIAALVLIIGGIQYALSAGDEEKQARAKATIKWTIVGLIIALAAYAIIFFVTDLLS